ncbi:MAG: hypothetical protein ACJ72Z_09175 [Pyrinomonadaceae bacterium]
MDEAEKLQPSVFRDDEGFSKLRNAINEIKTKPTQAAILRTLVQAASDFAPRGAFFIVKNDHLVGWKVFGSVQVDENTARSIHFPVTSETVLSRAVTSLETNTASADENSGDSQFLGPLSFGMPENMIAIPLAARGRGVAVVYADGGFENGRVNTEALETLVSVAGLSVELLAGGTAPAQESETVKPVEEPAAVVNVEAEPEYVGEVEVAEQESVTEEPAAAEFEVERVSEPVQTSDFAFSENNLSDTPAPDPVERVAEEVETEPEIAEAEPAVVEQPRYHHTSRSVDLPIEVSDDERDAHTKARRFARLLISEIRLYNEPKVVEGRDSGEIYEVLKEAIDRSREMYDKRVQPDVAAKFDYFHYELVNNLAEGNEEKLGAGYMAVKA